MNREQWLMESVKMLTPLFGKLNKEIPAKLRASCGFPSKNPLGMGKRSIGECWPITVSTDGTHELFVSPTIDEPLEVLGVLVHEVVHAVVGTKEKHAGMFKIVATAIGLEGKMTATTVGYRLQEPLKRISEKLGPYPHKKIDCSKMEKKKKESNPLVKAVCPDCEYLIKIKPELVAEFGLPTCPCGTEFQLDD